MGLSSKLEVKRINRYLLGTLTEEEQLRFEDEYFADGERFEHLEAAENDLVDSYVGGALSAFDRRQFESHYLSSPRHGAGLSFASALSEVSAKHEPHVAHNWSLHGLFRWAGPQKLMFACGFSVLLIAVTLLAFQNLRLRSDLKHVRAITSELQANQASLHEQVARLKNRIASDPGSVQTLEIAKLKIPPLSQQTLTLTPGNLRAVGQETPTLFLIHASSVVIQLVLDPGGGEAKSYTARIKSVNPPFVDLSFRDLPVVRDYDGQKIVSLVTDARSLKPGDYIVTLHRVLNSKEDIEVATYSFEARQHRALPAQSVTEAPFPK